MKQRIATGIIAAGVFLPLVIIGGLPFVVFIYLMATVSLFELFRMKKLKVLSLPGVLSFLLLWVFLLPTEYEVIFEHIDGGRTEILFLGLFLLMSLSVLSKNGFSYEDVAFCVLSVFYVGIGFYYLLLTREVGLAYIMFGLLLIWATDSGAYFTGRKFGKRKLWPDISPNKTVEGSIGGILSALLVAIIFYFYTEMGETISLTLLLFYSVILSIFGQLGDLVESALKRHFNVKDSGKILPGHGGVLDRVDSWLFVMPLLHFLQII